MSVNVCVGNTVTCREGDSNPSDATGRDMIGGLNAHVVGN